MKRILSLSAALLLLLLSTSSCKSKDVPREDPYDKIDRAYDEHMDKNAEEYDKEPD